MNKLLISLGVMVLVLVLAGVIANTGGSSLGSVATPDAYYSTTTSFANGVGWTGARVVTGTTTAKSGVLGSVVITKSTAAPISIYDATTTDITKRASVATSSITLATFGASVAAGTYTFDTVFNTGLLIDPMGTGLVASSTVTWK